MGEDKNIGQGPTSERARRPSREECPGRSHPPASRLPCVRRSTRQLLYIQVYRLWALNRIEQLGAGGTNQSRAGRPQIDIMVVDTLWQVRVMVDTTSLSGVLPILDKPSPLQL